MTARAVRARGPSGSRRPLVKMTVILLCLVGVSLIFILEGQRHISTMVSRDLASPKDRKSGLDIQLMATTSSLEETFTETPSQAPESTATEPKPTPGPRSDDVASVSPLMAAASLPEPSESTETMTTSEVKTTTPPESEKPLPSTTPPAPSETTTRALPLHPQTYDASFDGNLSTDFECVGWRHTGQSSPDGPREPKKDRSCQTPIPGCISGYCVFRHKQSGALRRAVLLSPGSMPCRLRIKCDAAAALLQYGQASVAYIHDPDFQFDKNRDNVRTHALSDLPTREAPADSPANAAQSGPQKLSFHRGITMVVHGKVLGSAYVSIRSLRTLGCTLPIEVWYRRDELQPDHPILKELESNYGVFVREILNPKATQYYTKLYAVFYSAFDHVMLLDADNFAVKDPSYLFETPEYQATGAMFWPDFWRPAATIFHIIEEDLLWQVLGIQFVDMFEQESGQLLIDRKKHQSAINVLMFYGFSMPRLVETMEFAWGDKDLFRFAWMKTNSSFHYIATPPGSAGVYVPQKQKFCGVTMVQHDPQGEIVFLHRNTEKMAAGNGNKRVWTHIQQFKRDAPISKYRVKNDVKTLGHNSCYSMKDYFMMTPMAQFPFQYIETELLEYAREAGSLVTRPLKKMD